jgi:rhamnogalacturonan endolyase
MGPKETSRGTRDVYNSVSRNFLAIAHLDGITPSIIAARGIYLAQKIVAFDMHLNTKWEKLIGLNTYNPVGELWKNENKLKRLLAKLNKDEYRGSHSLPIGDINKDGREEILWGEMCIGEGGKEIWKIKERFPYNGHADIVSIADINPNNDGNEIFYCREGWGKSDDKVGMSVFDNRGELLWGRWGFTHVAAGFRG